MRSPKQSNNFIFFLIVYQILISIVAGKILRLIGPAVAVPMWANLLISQLLSFAIPCCVVLFFNSHRIKEILPAKRLGIKNIFMIIGMTIAIQPITMLLAAFTSLFFGNEIGEIVAEVNSGGNILVTLAFVAVVPAILEEITMRGIVLGGYKNVRIMTAALMNGLFFGILHLSLQQFTYAFLFGILLSYLVYYTKSIFASMLSHFTLNASQSILSFLVISQSSAEITAEAAEMQTALAGKEMLIGILFYLVLALLTTPVFAILFSNFKKHNLERNITFETFDEITEINEKKEAPPKIFNWGLIGTVILYFLLVVLPFIIEKAIALL